ncbi:MAG: alpha/beta fold hydrolase [Acidimicrobiia bacterium]
MSEVIRPVVLSKRTFVDNRVVFYDVCGDGSPVLFLHGWGLAQRSYRGALRGLAARGFQVIAPAQPGFGGTPQLARRQFSLAGYARWLDGFCSAVELAEPAVVIGHSFGGGVAIRFAHDYAHRVRALMLVNSIGGTAWKQGKGLRTLAERPLWDWGLHFPADIWPLPQATRVIPVMLEDALPNAVRNPLSLVKVANLARRADLTGELEELKRRGLPITVLWGRRDGIIPKEAFEEMCAAAGQPGTVVDGSHSWLLANPEHFAEVITNSLAVAKVAGAIEPPADAPKRAGSRRRKPSAPAELPTITGEQLPDA